MARNRRNQSAAIRFGPALKALFLCLLLAGSALGYVWQKSQIYDLGRQIRHREIRLNQLKDTNEKLRDQLAILRTPTQLDRRVRELRLGLQPAQPSQIWVLPEPVVPTHEPPPPRQFASRLGGVTAP